MIIKARVENGIIFYDDDNVFNEEVQKFEGQEVSIVIKKWRNTRSLSQNRLLWNFYKLIEKETGNDAKDLHEYFKRALLEPKILEVLGKKIKVPASTTQLDKLQFSEYIKKIERETGIICPSWEDINLLEQYNTK